MGDYTNMSDYYDVIMTSGYYDYEKIVENILTDQSVKNILELGCGTGLILEELARRQPNCMITGMDLTEAMLKIARKRLQPFSNVFLSKQNVTCLTLQEQYDLVFSYGGVWYFVIDGDKEPFMVSHLPCAMDNRQGFAQLAKYVSAGGTLLLGIQGPHYDYEKVIVNGMKYAQKVKACAEGFMKDYYLIDGTETVMAQTIHYRTYAFAEAQQLLATYGFQYQPMEKANDKLFLEFKKL